MSKSIIQLNEENVKSELKELVRKSWSIVKKVDRK